MRQETPSERNGDSRLFGGHPCARPANEPVATLLSLARLLARQAAREAHAKTLSIEALAQPKGPGAPADVRLPTRDAPQLLARGDGAREPRQ